MKRAWGVLLWFLLASGAFGQTPTQIEGTATSDAPDYNFQMKTADGLTVVMLKTGFQLVRRAKAGLTDLKSSDWVSVESETGPGNNQWARSLVFLSPETSRTVRKGQFALPTGNRMTNAMVDQIQVAGDNSGLILKAQGATFAILAAAGTPVSRLTDAVIADIKPGVRIIAQGIAHTDGSFWSDYVIVAPPAEAVSR